MKKRYQPSNVFTCCLLWLVAEAITINGELADRSENELKILTKRDAHDIDILQELENEKNERSSLKDFAKQLYDIYGDNDGKRDLETVEHIDLDPVDKNDTPYLMLQPLDDSMETDYLNDKDETFEGDDEKEKRGVDSYSVFGRLGKRLRAPMGFTGRLGKRRDNISDYDKRIPLGFIGTIGKRSPMGFFGQLGKRSPMGFFGQLGKRSPMGFFGQLGKRSPMGFFGQLGKRAPMGFRGQLGKRAPMGFIGQLGKRAPMGFLGNLGKRDPKYFGGPDRRAPMGFLGRLGKRGSPMGFIGQLGKRDI